MPGHSTGFRQVGHISLATTPRRQEVLALDALYTEWAAARPQPRDTGSLRGDLLSLLRPWARLAGSRPYGRVIAALEHLDTDLPPGPGSARG